MSRIGVFIATLVALALAVTAWVLLGANPSSPANPTDGNHTKNIDTTPILSFSPAKVEEIVIKPTIGAEQRITRIDNRWRLTIASDNQHSPNQWPIVGAQIRGLLSILQRLVAQAPASGASLPADALTLHLGLRDGSTQTLRLDRTSIGGRRLVQANNQPPVFINQPIYQALTRPGPLGWRDNHLFQNVSVETSHVELHLGDRAITLARVQGKWFLRKPASAPADPVAVGQLLDRLASLKALRWIDDPTARPLPNDPAWAEASTTPGVIAVEREERILEDNNTPRIVRHREHITLGPPADLAGKEQYVYVGANPAPVVVDASTIAALLIDPASLVSKQAVNATGSQVAAITIVTAPSTSTSPHTQTLARSLDGWTRQTSDHQPSPIPTPLVSELLALLTTRDADDISFTEPTGPSLFVRLTLRGFRDADLQSVLVFNSADGLVIQTNNIFRAYHNVEIPAILTNE